MNVQSLKLCIVYVYTKSARPKLKICLTALHIKQPSSLYLLQKIKKNFFYIPFHHTINISFDDLNLAQFKV